MPDSPDALDAPDATTTDDAAPQPVLIRLSGGWHPDLNRPGLFLGQGTFEALRYADGHLELLGVDLPPLLPPGSLASAAPDLPDAAATDNAVTEGSAPEPPTPPSDEPPDEPPDAAVEAPVAPDTQEAPPVPTAPDAPSESHDSAPEAEDALEDDAESDAAPPEIEAASLPETEPAPLPEEDE